MKIKWKKAGPAESPLGWMIAAGVVALAASPAVRKTIRKAVVKGTSYVMEAAEKIQEKFGRENEHPAASVYPMDFRSSAAEPEKGAPPVSDPSMFRKDTATEEEENLDFPGSETMLSVEIEPKEPGKAEPDEERGDHR